MYLMGVAPLAAQASRELSFERESIQIQESDEEKHDISADGYKEEEEYIFNAKEIRHATSKTSREMQAKNSEYKSKSGSTSLIDTMTGGSQSKGISLINTLERQKSPTRGSSKSQSASQNKETSKPSHMEMGSHAKKKTAGDEDPDDPDDPSAEACGYGDDNRTPDRQRRPEEEQEAADTDRSVREITPSMQEWEKVTGHKQIPSAKKSKQLPTARGLAKIRDSETGDGKSQKWIDQMTFDQWRQRVVI